MAAALFFLIQPGLPGQYSQRTKAMTLFREDSMAGPSALVVSAHAADFVWRAGGAIALHAAKGYAVTIVCLSFGERGESAKLWKDPGAPLQGVKIGSASGRERVCEYV